MTKLLLSILALSFALHAEGPDAKRNHRVQRLAATAAKAQATYASELKSWQSECDAKGLELRPVAANLMDCEPKQAAPALNPAQQRMMQHAKPPETPTAKPEAEK